jgi:hypothetical protein
MREDGCQPALPVLLAALRVWSAVAYGDSMFEHMVLLASDSIGSTVLLELLIAALQAGNEQAFRYLWCQPATNGLNSVDLRQLWCIASKSGTRLFYTVERLLREHHAWDAGCGVTEDELAAQQPLLADVDSWLA